MCFVKKLTEEEFKKKRIPALITDKDIEVYKYTTTFLIKCEVFSSHVFKYPHYKNRTNPTIQLKRIYHEVFKLLISKDKYLREYCMEIEEGYHSYNSLETAKKFMSKDMSCYDTTLFLKYTIGKFIIPKGSKYFKNEEGELVSSNIIFKEIIKDK
jgi:hypothetical protein